MNINTLYQYCKNRWHDDHSIWSRAKTTNIPTDMVHSIHVTTAMNIKCISESVKHPFICNLATIISSRVKTSTNFRGKQISPSIHWGCIKKGFLCVQHDTKEKRRHAFSWYMQPRDGLKTITWFHCHLITLPLFIYDFQVQFHSTDTNKETLILFPTCSTFVEEHKFWQLSRSKAWRVLVAQLFRLFITVLIKKTIEHIYLIMSKHHLASTWKEIFTLL